MAKPVEKTYMDYWKIGMPWLFSKSSEDREKNPTSIERIIDGASSSFKKNPFELIANDVKDIASKFKPASTDSILIYIVFSLIFISIFGNIAAITTIGNKDNWNENTKNMIITLSILTLGVISYTIFICWYFNKNPHSNMYLVKTQTNFYLYPSNFH